jgi:hypothetical protein
MPPVFSCDTHACRGRDLATGEKKKTECGVMTASSSFVKIPLVSFLKDPFIALKVEVIRPAAATQRAFFLQTVLSICRDRFATCPVCHAVVMQRRYSGGAYSICIYSHAK